MNILYFILSENDDSQSYFITQAIEKTIEKTEHRLYLYSNQPLLSYLSDTTTIKENEILIKKWDLILIQNSLCFFEYAKVLKSLKNTPSIFISYNETIKSSVILYNQLFSVFTTNKFFTKIFGIPDHLQKEIIIPTIPLKFEQNKKTVAGSIMYFPTSKTIQNEYRVISMLKQISLMLIVVTDNYQYASCILSTHDIKVIRRDKAFSYIRNMHLVIASGYDAIQSIAVCKPTIVLGDYGLAGQVNLLNYEILHKFNFGGRIGGFFGEFIPLDLLLAQISKSFDYKNLPELETLQKIVLNDFSFDKFRAIFLSEIEKLNKIQTFFNKEKSQPDLFPILTTNLDFNLKNTDGYSYIKLNKKEAIEIDPILSNILKKCNGKYTIQQIMEKNLITKKESVTFLHNLKVLWKNQLIDFN